MLTQFHPFPELSTELKLRIIEELVSDIDFPKSLLSFSLTSQHQRVLAHDWSLWRLAIERFFPAVPTYKKAAYLNDSFALFQSLFRTLQPLLVAHHLTFSDFIKVVIEQQAILDERQLEVILGLLLAAGHPLLKGTTLNPTIAEHALLFATVLGNSELVDTLLSERKFHICKTVVCQALLDAARLNHPFILGSLLTNMNHLLDGTTLRNALTSAASKGHTRIVAQFLQHPFLRVVSFTLKKVVHIAILHGYPDILSLILRGDDTHRYACDIRTGAIEAAQNGSVAGIEKAFQLASAQFDDVTIRKLLKVAAQRGNLVLTQLFVATPAVLRHPNALLESLQLALHEGHESTALLLLQSGRAILKPFVKRELYLEAVKKGFNSLIDELNDHGHLKVDGSFYQTAVNLAKIYDKEDTIEHLTAAMSQLTVEEVSRPITPSFARHSSPYRSQSLADTTQDCRRGFVL
ncbi:MAG: hypothetical protein AB7I18_01520 [Candidatus Berkiella sp.]